MTYPVYVSDQKFENFMDLLMITDKNKSHDVYIKDFKRFMYNKIKIKKTFENNVYNVSVVKNIDKTQRNLFENKW